MTDIPTLDLVVMGVVALSAVIGAVRGLAREVLSLLIWVAAFLGAFYFGPMVDDWMDLNWGFDDVAGYIVVFVAVLVLGSLAKNATARLLEATGLTGLDRTLGLAFGSARGLLICVVVLVAVRPFAEHADWWRASFTRPMLVQFEDELVGFFWGEEDGDPPRHAPGDSSAPSVACYGEQAQRRSGGAEAAPCRPNGIVL